MRIFYILLGFNSSMVRLKEVDPAGRWTSSLFQFQYGAIKGLRSIQPEGGLQACFNSSMVRLKVDSTFQDLQVPDEFQFQYGAIKGK